MERGILKRRLEYVACFDGEVADVLSGLGVSTAVCTSLRKQLGLVCKIVDGEEVAIRLNQRLDSGDRFCIYLTDLDVKEVPKWDMPVDIVYEDEDIAVIDKRAGMAVIPVKGHFGRSLANALANIWGDFVYRPVNRLDRDTSGLMIVAKNQLAHCVLAQEHIDREYVGLCSGTYCGDSAGVWDYPIDRLDGGFKRYICDSGKRAVTHYKFVRQYDGYFCAKFVLETGRTHQIRVHTAYIGHPLCCDRLYNPDPSAVICPNGFKLDRQALHSCRITFRHPIDGREMTFFSQAEFLKEV